MIALSKKEASPATAGQVDNLLMGNDDIKEIDNSAYFLAAIIVSATLFGTMS